MVTRLTTTGVIRTETVQRVLGEVPRHRFISDAATETAYADNAVVVKRAADGTALSSASQPTIVATMLERLDVESGQRVLEIGTGTGYNAALLSNLVGSDGCVVSVEIEPDLAERAVRTLAEVGIEGVQVVVGDGRLGYPPLAPYDRVIVTTGASCVADAWPDQLVDGGRLVTPIVEQNGVGSILVLAKVDGQLVTLHESPCGFLPMRDHSSE